MTPREWWLKNKGLERDEKATKQCGHVLTDMPACSSCIPLATGYIFMRAQSSCGNLYCTWISFFHVLNPQDCRKTHQTHFQLLAVPSGGCEVRVPAEEQKAALETWNTTCDSIVSRTALRWGWRSGPAVCPGFEQELLRSKTRISGAWHIQHFTPFGLWTQQAWVHSKDFYLLFFCWF